MRVRLLMLSIAVGWTTCEDRTRCKPYSPLKCRLLISSQRAVYARADLTLLDDVLAGESAHYVCECPSSPISAVDNHVARHIFGKNILAVLTDPEKGYQIMLLVLEDYWPTREEFLLPTVLRILPKRRTLS